jgi:hypothetical protein
MSNTKDITDVLTLLTDLGKVAVALKQSGAINNIFVDIQIATQLWAPVKAVLADAPTMFTELPAEIKTLDLATAQSLLASLVSLEQAWAPLFQAPAA